LRLIFCTLLLLDVFKPPTALSGGQEEQLPFSRFTRAGSPGGQLQILLTLRLAGKGMAEPHFSSTFRYQRATKNDIFAARSPYRSLLCRTIMANPGGGMLILFWEILGKKAGQEKNTAKCFAILLHGRYTNAGQKTRNGSKVSTKGGKK
jgi:hypothetical protein